MEMRGNLTINAYVGVHRWVYKWFGKATHCSNCKNKEYEHYHWHNKSGKYKREFSDWISLCPYCHKGLELKGELPIFD